MDRFIFLDEKEVTYISDILKSWDSEKVDILKDNIFVDEKLVDGLKNHESKRNEYKGFLWIGDNLTFVRIDYVRDFQL